MQALRPAAAVLGQRYGAWQIVPTRLFELLRDPDRQKAKRVTEAMLQLRKLDIGGPERGAAQG